MERIGKNLNLDLSALLNKNRNHLIYKIECRHLLKHTTKFFSPCLKDKIHLCEFNGLGVCMHVNHMLFGFWIVLACI